MNIVWTKIVPVLVAVVAATSAYAANPTVNVLNINRTDGEVERLMLHQKLNVTLSSEGNIRLEHPEICVEIPAEQVRDFTFEQNDKMTGVYDGNHEASIEVIEADGSPLLLSPREISSSKGIEVYNLKGNCVVRQSPVEGRAVVDISGMPKGVYIVKSGSVTLKVSL